MTHGASQHKDTGTPHRDIETQCSEALSETPHLLTGNNRNHGLFLAACQLLTMAETQADSDAESYSGNRSSGLLSAQTCVNSGCKI